ncbi:MAG TPA: hypothetical protein VGN00_14355 [Puia sp.]|jgi:hypothetical protein
MRFKIFLSLIAIITFASCSAQSFFKPIPKQPQRARFIQVYGDSVIASPSVPTTTAFRPILNAVTYSEPDHIAMAGIGVSYQWLKYNNTTQKWETTFAINGLFYGGAGLASPNQGIYAAGPSISLLNGFISFGGAYNFTTKKIGPTLGINVQLNN